MRLAGLEGLGRLMRIDGLRTLDWLMRLGILLAAMVLTAGCSGGSSDEPGPDTPTPGPGESSTPIAFSVQQDEGQGVTRAGTPLKDIVTSFKVWGFKNMSDGTLQTVFPGYSVNWISSESAHSTTTNSDGWEYVNQQTGSDSEQTVKYWDWSASAYRFFGVAETPTGVGYANYSRWAEGVIVLTVDATNDAGFIATPYYSRLWYSTGNLGDYPTRQFGQPVQLEFLKPISKVRFKFTSADPNVTVEELLLSDPIFKPASGKIAVTGTLTVTYPLTGAGTSETWSAVREGTIDKFESPETWYTVLPTRGQREYELTVFVNGTEKTCFVPAVYMDWQPGFEYTYIFKVNEEGGVEFGGVLSAYTDWQPGAEADHTVYNW